MPYSEIAPIQNLDQVGIIYDTPAPSLPPNAFTDALNVRFRDGTIRKMQGEVNILPNIFDDSSNQVGGIDVNYDGSLLKYVCFWPNPNLIGGNSGYYIVITEETRLVADDTVPPPANVDPTHQRDVVYLVSVDGTQKVQKGIYSATPAENWQHEFFQGGFAIILNNVLDAPQYILDEVDNTDINAVPNLLQLPGWESYNIDQINLKDAFDPTSDSYIFDLGQKIDFNNFELVVTRINSKAPKEVVTLTPHGTGANLAGYTPPSFSTMTTSPWTTSDVYQIFNDSVSGTTVLNLPNNISSVGTDIVQVNIRSRNSVTVRCGVIKAFGDFLVAGDLLERDENDNQIVLRSIPGTIRTSDVAKPGAIPNNWNPFAAGVSTADEFIISETSPVQDMAEMQGNLYIYANDSIKVLRLTGNASVPIAVSPAAESLGCQTRGAVTEFDGKHFVVGSKDIYLFGGNPGATESVANDRVRRYLYNNLNPVYADRLFTFNNKQQDEIWICYATKKTDSNVCDEALIWSYRNNTWTRRELRGVVSGSVGLIPGGGLPNTRVTISGVTGSNGVTNVGAYEVRVLGTDSTLEYYSSSAFYRAVSSGLIYGNGRYAVARTDVGVTQEMYVNNVVYPQVSITGPDGVSHSLTLPTANVDGVTPVTGQNIWDAVQAELETAEGWTFNTLPSGYSQETGTVRLISSQDEGDFLGLRDVDATIPFAINVTDFGTVSNSAILGTDLGFQESTTDATVHGVTVVTGTGGNDYRGEFVLRATPTIMGIRLNAPLATGGEKMLFLDAGTNLNYNPATHTGTTNGTTLTSEEVVASWINTINLYSTKLTASEGTTSSEIVIQPTDLSEEAEVIAEIRLNDTAANAQWIWDKYQETVAGSIELVDYSVIPFTNPVNFDNPETKVVVQHSTAPAIAGSLDTQFAPDGSRTPSRTTSFTLASTAAAVNNENVYSVDRPWSKSEVNPNLEFPILASRTRIPDVNSEIVYMNKVLAADVGWSIPSAVYNPRVVTADPELYSEVVTGNDAPTHYTSYVERKQLNYAPNKDTETVHQLSLWASGFYIPYIGESAVFNRLQLRYKATDNTAQRTDLSVVSGDIKKNVFFISESNKMDTRIHGRYLNFRLTDEIQDNNGLEITATSNSKRTTNTVFDKMSLWEISGIQMEVNKGGRR